MISNGLNLQGKLSDSAHALRKAQARHKSQRGHPLAGPGQMAYLSSPVQNARVTRQDGSTAHAKLTPIVPDMHWFLTEGFSLALELRRQASIMTFL